MPDRILNIGNSQIQHGPDNDRIYLMKLDVEDAENTLVCIEELAGREKYSKIFAKVPAPARSIFKQHGFIEEAYIPKYYHGKTDVYFMSRFLDIERGVAGDADKQREILELAGEKGAAAHPESALPTDCLHRVCEGSDIPDIVDVYRKVFESYPFPIHDPEYIAETMKKNVTYFGVWESNQLIALASAERDLAADSVEMTDFATLPAARGRGLGVFLLQRMGKEMAGSGVYTAYTIARAVSAGMNIVFAKLGYQYGGTLTNNTDICGRLESMNIWWKHLEPIPPYYS